jgi:hypothetical protein
MLAVLIEHGLYQHCPRHRWHVQNAIRFWRPRHGRPPQVLLLHDAHCCRRQEPATLIGALRDELLALACFRLAIRKSDGG